ncbi:uncharacterized protein LOC62_02G002688 [Vanrija pseudolonga]|uniref:Uncharacterized protein n=1 Tax=Vanrija pseudolonga TaxID=143232 RepID=A0AAF1BPB2_9TREE|nr:hypothetical protein LOC62_02G002688 [Vanrija pseudolonga]
MGRFNHLLRPRPPQNGHAPPQPAGTQTPRVPQYLGPPHAPHDAGQWSVDALLHVLNPLPACQRYGTVARIGAAMRQQHQVHAANLCSQLEALDNFYARGIAAGLATAAGLNAWTSAHVGNNNAFIQAWALRSARELGPAIDDKVFEDVVAPLTPGAVPLATRRQCLDSLEGRTALVDRLVAKFMDYAGQQVDPESAERILGFASPQVVQRYLPDLLHMLAHPKRLARRHPEELVAALEADLARVAGAVGARVWPWWDARARTIASLLKYAPHLITRVFAWVDRWDFHKEVEADGESRFELVPRVLFDLQAARLARYEPDRIVALQLDNNMTHERMSQNTRRRWLANLSDDALERYTDFWAGAEPSERDTFLRYLAPKRRLETAAKMMGKGPTHLALAELLHRSDAAGLARTALKDMESKNDGWTLEAHWLKLLPPAEARPRLLARTRHPGRETTEAEDDERAVAWCMLIENAQRSGDPAALTAVLEQLAPALAGEEPSVRARAQNTLVALPKRLFAAEGLPHLDRIIDDLMVPDCFLPRDVVVQVWAFHVISVVSAHPTSPRHAAWWDHQFHRLMRSVDDSTQISAPWDDFTIRWGEEHAVWAAFKPLIDVARASDSFALLACVCKSLGRKSYRLAPLQAELAAFIDNPAAVTSLSGQANLDTAIKFYLADSATRDERVAHVVAKHPSAIKLWPVGRRVMSARTDLLTQYLVHPVPVGVFNRPDALQTLIFPKRDHLNRCTLDQHNAFRDVRAARLSLPTLPDDHEGPQCSFDEKAASILTLCVLHGGYDVIEQYPIDREDEHKFELHRMRIFSYIDKPDGIGRTLHNAGTPFTYTVMGTCWSRSKLVPAQELQNELNIVMNDEQNDKWTRTEAARMVVSRNPIPLATTMVERFARLAVDEKGEWAWSVAVKQALRHLLAFDGAWTLIDHAVEQHGTPMLRLLLDTKPWQMAQSVRDRYVKYLVPLLEHDDDSLAQAAVEAMDDWIPYSADIIPALSRIVTNFDIEDKGLWQAAADLLAYSATDEATISLLCVTMQKLVDYPPEPDAGEDADRPGYRRAKHILDYYNADLGEDDPFHHPAERALADVLATHPELFFDAVNLLLTCIDLDWSADRILAHLELVIERAGPHSGLSWGFSVNVGEVVKGRKSTPERLETLHEVAQVLIAKDDLMSNMFANWIVIECGDHAGWPEEWRDLLRNLRRHPRIEVRYFAIQTDTSSQDE